MKGLCQKCHSSNVEITVQDGIPVCAVCTKKNRLIKKCYFEKRSLREIIQYS